MNAPIKTPALPLFPIRRTYRDAPFFELPFVQRARRGVDRSDWVIPPVADYAEACALGREYASHLVQWFKDHPGLAGSNVLGDIVKDMDLSDKSDTKGVAVGFFVELERYILAGARGLDPFEVADSEHAKCAEIEAARVAEKAQRARRSS